ncbi:MAG TPA: putative Ig domain-containing protein [Candidatus Dormibacteraeota bacterium]
MALAVGFVLVGAGCAAPQSVVNQKPAGTVTTSPTDPATPSPSPPPLAITAAPFHAGEIGFSYTPVSPTATGGVPPYRWEIADGALPSGLGMASSGNVTGTPTILGTFLFSIRVSDSAGATTAMQSSISISRRVIVTGNPCTPVSPCSVEAGCLTVCGVFGFQSGGIAPFKYKVTSGALPTGMALSGFSLTKAFPAPASQAGKDWVFTVRVTDAIGATAETTAKFHVFPHIAFTAPATATCDGSWSNGCTFPKPLAYTLGTPGLAQAQFTVVSGLKLPFKLQGLAVTGITGSTNPCPTNGYIGQTVKLVLYDTSTCAANQYCTSGPATVTVTLRCP